MEKNKIEKLQEQISLICSNKCQDHSKSALISQLKSFLFDDFDKSNPQHIVIVMASLNVLELI